MTSLMRLIEEMKIHFFRYDVLPVFEIVTYDDSDCSTILEHKYLITDYGTITTEEVRRSNYWYMYCVDGDDAKGFQESMQWSCDYLERSMDASLKSRCMNSYLEESATQRGGPLLFRIMMDYLVRNTRTAAQHMVKKIESYKISDTAGEDVTKLKAIVVATVKRLEHMKDPTTNRPYLPDDLNSKLITVLQTSSVGSFNEVFSTIYKNAKTNAKPREDPKLPDVMHLMGKAESEYMELCAENKWTGTNTTESRNSVFQAGGRQRQHQSGKSKPKCHNCGSPKHLLPECPKPRDEARIKAARDAFFKSKKASAGTQASGSNDDETPPTEQERKNGNLRWPNKKGGYSFFRKGTWTELSADEVEFSSGKPRRIKKTPTQPPPTTPPPPAAGSGNPSMVITGDDAQTVFSALTNPTLTPEDRIHIQAALRDSGLISTLRNFTSRS